ncbi:hypothetical protein [Kribbella swartbergensis]
MSVELWSAILAAAALLVALVAAYFAKHSATAAERSAIAAERSADAARDQADETRRANELVEQARRRGVRAPDATTESARAVGWEVERGSDKNVLRLRNVGEATATNVTVEPKSWFIMQVDTDRFAGHDGPTVEPNEALDLSLVGAFGQAVSTFVLVSWDGLVAPVRVPIPPQ